MAKIIVRACKEEYGDYEKYKTYIKDFDDIPSFYKEYVLKAYSKGLITGYTDGTFGGEKTMSRSEATAVVARLLDKSQRILPGEPSKEEPVKEERKQVNTPRPPGNDNDLFDVPRYSEAGFAFLSSEESKKHYNVDFRAMLYTKYPLEPQHEDLENVLKARFGENNAKVKEVMNYVRKKKDYKDSLPSKDWIINGYTVNVWSPGGDSTMAIIVWSVVW